MLDRSLLSVKLQWCCTVLVTLLTLILDYQGVVSVEEDSRRMLLQAVHELFDRQFTSPWQPGENRTNRIVFIGQCFKGCFKSL